MKKRKILTEECTIMYLWMCVRLFVVCTNLSFLSIIMHTVQFSTTWSRYFCIGTLFIQGTDGCVDIALLMKSIQYFVSFSLCWICRPKFDSLHICHKTCSESRIAHLFSCGSPHCNIHIIADMREYRPAWSHTLLVRPSRLIPVFQPLW